MIVEIHLISYFLFFAPQNMCSKVLAAISAPNTRLRITTCLEQSLSSLCISSLQGTPTDLLEKTSHFFLGCSGIVFVFFTPSRWFWIPLGRLEVKTDFYASEKSLFYDGV